MGRIFGFLGEDIFGVDGTQDVEYANIAIDDGFADLTFAEIDEFHSFVCERFTPRDAGFIVVVDRDSVEGVCHAKVFGTQADVQYFLGTFVGGKNFCLA